MSQNSLNMSDFILLRRDDPFFKMPVDSLIILCGHTPIMKKILHYLPLDAKKNLRIAHPRKLKEIISQLDPIFSVWTIYLPRARMSVKAMHNALALRKHTETVYLGKTLQFPLCFYNSLTPVHLKFPKDDHGEYIEDPVNCDEMMLLIDEIRPRVVGLSIHARVISNEVALLKDSKITDLAENWICCTYDPYK